MLSRLHEIIWSGSRFWGRASTIWISTRIRFGTFSVDVPFLESVNWKIRSYYVENLSRDLIECWFDLDISARGALPGRCRRRNSNHRAVIVVVVVGGGGGYCCGDGFRRCGVTVVNNSSQPAGAWLFGGKLYSHLYWQKEVSVTRMKDCVRSYKMPTVVETDWFS